MGSVVRGVRAADAAMDHADLSHPGRPGPGRREDYGVTPARGRAHMGADRPARGRAHEAESRGVGLEVHGPHVCHRRSGPLELSTVYEYAIWPTREIRGPAHGPSGHSL